jgi:hypothetical protein
MATATGLREPLEFTPNVPVEIALAYQTGKIVKGINADRVMFSLVGGGVMFLDLGPAEKINALGVKAREPFFICKHWSGKKGEPPEFNAWLAPEAEKRRAQADARAAGDSGTERKLGQSIERAEAIKARVGSQADGTFVVPGTGAVTPAPALAGPTAQSTNTNNGNGNKNGGGNGNGHPSTASAGDARPPLMPWALFLLSQTRQLIDVYALACQHASEAHGNTVKTEDVRALLLSAFIAQTKNGGPSVA